MNVIVFGKSSSIFPHLKASLEELGINVYTVSRPRNHILLSTPNAYKDSLTMLLSSIKAQPCACIYLWHGSSAKSCRIINQDSPSCKLAYYTAHAIAMSEIPVYLFSTIKLFENIDNIISGHRDRVNLISDYCKTKKELENIFTSIAGIHCKTLRLPGIVARGSSSSLFSKIYNNMPVEVIINPNSDKPILTNMFTDVVSLAKLVKHDVESDSLQAGRPIPIATTEPIDMRKISRNYPNARIIYSPSFLPINVSLAWMPKATSQVMGSRHVFPRLRASI